MQVDHAGAPGRLVQAVHVLREQELALALDLQTRERIVRPVGSRPAEGPPPDQAARPVALTRRRAAHESLVGHGLRPLPVPVGVAVVGDARVGAAAGSGQHEQPLMAVDELLQLFGFEHARDVGWQPAATIPSRPVLIGAEIMRLKGGVLVEHWGNMTAMGLAPPAPVF